MIDQIAVHTCNCYNPGILIMTIRKLPWFLVMPVPELKLVTAHMHENHKYYAMIYYRVANAYKKHGGRMLSILRTNKLII